MGLILAEVSKIIKQRYVSGTLLVLIFLSFLLFSTHAVTGNFGATFGASAYRKMVAEVDFSDPENESERISETADAMLFEDEMPEKMYTGSRNTEIRLYRLVGEELEQIAGYSDYLEQIMEASVRAGSISLFQSSSLDTVEAKKAAADFSDMENVEPEFIGSYGVALFMGTDFWTVALVIVSLILAAALATDEIEGHGVRLLHSTVYGKKTVVYAKYVAGLIVLALFTTTTALSRLAVTLAAYGSSGWLSPFQSVYGASGCTLKINIWQGILLFALYKLLAIFFLYTIFFVAALLVKNSIGLYLSGILILAAEYAAYYLIPSTGYLSIIKWLNLIAVLHTDSLLMEYQNLKLAGTVLSWQMTAGLSGSLLTLFFLCIMGRLFGSIRPVSGSNSDSKTPHLWKRGGKHTDMNCMRKECVNILTGGDSLFGFENRKWSLYQGGALVLVLLFAGILIFSPTVSERLYTEEEIYYKYYISQIEGNFSEKKLEYLYEEEERLQLLAQDIVENGDSYTDAAMNYYNNELKKRSGLALAIGYGEYLKDNGGSFVYGQGYELLFAQGNGAGYVLLYRICSLIVMVLLSGMLWGIDTQTEMNALLRVSCLGERKIRVRKRLNILLMGLLIGICTWVPWTANVFSVFGCGMILEPANSLQMFSFVPARISICAMLGLYYCLHIAWLWLVGVACERAEIVLKNRFLTMISVFAVGFLLVLLLAALGM